MQACDFISVSIGHFFLMLFTDHPGENSQPKLPVFDKLQDCAVI